MKTFPIVLAHGIARFDAVRERFVSLLDIADKVPDRLHYFRGIRTHLAGQGFEVFHSTVNFAGSVALRAGELKSNVEGVLKSTGQRKVHIIGHSMGGLDARHMIVDSGMAPRVCSLTTVGTPHKGSSFADWVVEHKGEEGVKKFHDFIDLDGLLDLRLAECKKFNDRAEPLEADNEVALYQTYSAHEEERARVFGLLQLSWDRITKAEGQNDGLVSVDSQRWRGELRGARTKKIVQKNFPVSADHLNEVGWWELNQLKGKSKTNIFKNPIKFFKRLFNEPREYENTVKGVYLDIAKDLAARFPS
jgi:triacylglycerol lipase